MSVEVEFAITTEADSDGTTIVRLAGELDLARVPELTDALTPATGRLVVDLSEVTFLDSTTLALLVKEHRRLEHAGGELVLLIGEQTPTTAFSVTGLDRIFTMRPSASP